MHEKIQKVLDNALEVIKTTLDNTGKYTLVLQKLMLIRVDQSDTDKGYQYFQDVYPKIKEAKDSTDDNADFEDAIGDLGYLLNEYHPIYNDIETKAVVEAQEVYACLVGIVEGE